MSYIIITLSRQGTTITDAESKRLTTYTNAGWKTSIWEINEGVSYPTLHRDGYDTITFSKQGTAITEAEARQRSTYESIYTTWDFTEIWDIEQGLEYPKFKPKQVPIIYQCQAIPFPLRMKQMTQALT